MKNLSIAGAKEAVNSTSQAGILGVIDRHGIPVSMNGSIGCAGRYSFKKVVDKATGKVVGATDRKIELNPNAHSNVLELGATLAHEAKHAEDETGGEFGDFQESDRPRAESRAESVQHQVTRELRDRCRAA
jgi:hypothetical protein